MRVVGKLLLVLVVAVVVAGFVRQWFAVSADRDTNQNKVHIQLSVDADKVKSDAQIVRDHARELTQGQ